jgi:hypothetical protein
MSVYVDACLLATACTLPIILSSSWLLACVAPLRHQVLHDLHLATLAGKVEWCVATIIHSLERPHRIPLVGKQADGAAVGLANMYANHIIKVMVSMYIYMQR